MAIHIDVIADIDQRAVKLEADRLARNLEEAGLRGGEGFGNGLQSGIRDVAPKVEKAIQGVMRSTDALTKSVIAEESAHEKTTSALMAYQRQAVSNKTTDEQLYNAKTRYLQALRAENEVIRQSTILGRAHDASRRDAIAAVRDYEHGIDSFINKTRDADEAMRRSMRLGDQLAEGISKVANALIPSSGIGTAAIPIVDALVSLVPVVASASQAIGVLPAVAGAAGVAFGTLQLATQGFGDALKNMGDPEKFAESLKALSPNAQQAALSIKSLMPVFDALQNRTQDAFSNGFGQQIQMLSSSYLPQVEQATTGIAGAFNSMMTNISQELMTPETSASIQTFLTNTTSAFQVLAPAAAPFVNAISTLMSVGSTELPKMTAGLTELANRFSNFVSTAAADGSLQHWLDEGLHTLNELGGSVSYFVERFMELAPIGDDIMPKVVSALDQTTDLIFGIVQSASATGSIFGLWSDALKTVNPILDAINGTAELLSISVGDTKTSFTEMISPLHMIATIIDSIKWFFDPGKRNQGLNEAVDKMNAKRAELGLPPATYTMPDQVTGDPYSYGGVQGHTGQQSGLGSLFGNGDGPTGTGSLFDLPPGLGGTGANFGLPLGIGMNPWGENPYAWKKKKSTGSGSSKGRHDAIAANLDPSLYAVGPGDSAGAYPGDYQEGIIEAQHTVEDKRHKLEEARKDRLILERDNTATEEQISDAKWKEHEAQRDFQKAQADVVQAQEKTTKNLRKGMDQLGAALDPDLGLSKGLAGFAENLVKFIGNIIAAPELAKLQAQVNADPIKGGYGLFGIRGAENIAAGNSPLLGRPMGPGGLASLLPGVGSMSGYPGDAALLSAIPRNGQYSQAAGRDLLKGFTDCSSAIGDLVSILDTGTTSPNKMSTGNAAQWLTQRGFVPGIGGPGDFRVGYNGGHMQATLPDGTPVNYGNPNGYTNAGIGSRGADDPAFNQHFYRPTSGGPLGLTNAGPTAPSQYVAPGVPPGMRPEDLLGPGGGFGGGPNGGFGLGGDPVILPRPTSDGLRIGWGNTAQYKIPGQPGYWKPKAPNGTSLSIGDTPSLAGPRQENRTSPPVPPGPGNGTGLPDILSNGFGSRPGTGPLSTSPRPYDIPGDIPTGQGNGQVGPFPVPNGIAPGGVPGMNIATAGVNAVSQGPTGYGGLGGATHPGAGPGIGLTPGGSLDTALGLGAMAFPGIGQAAQTGIKEGSRAIQYAGQLAGIATQGVMDTFLPTGGSALAQNSWFTRIIGGLAGATPAIPNTAGGAQGQAQQNGAQPPLTPEQALSQHLGTGAPPGPGNNITINTNQEAEGDRLGRTVSYLNENSNQPAGRR